MTVKGIKYRKGLYVVIGREDDVLFVGEIKLVLIHSELQVYFVVKSCQTVLQVHMDVYLVHDIEQCSPFVCLRHEELLDYYPLPEHKVNGLSMLILHHSFPSL